MALFIRLRALAGDRDEDFTTESLGIVLDHLLEIDPPYGLELAKLLSAGRIDPSLTDAGAVTTDTRPHGDRDIPDLVLSTGIVLSYVEAKLESGLHHDQLARYRRKLARSGAPKTSLVTLTRYPLGHVDPEPDARLTWLGLAEWFTTLLNASTLSQSSRYLVTQFVQFLRGRGLALYPPRSGMARAFADYILKHPEDNILVGKSVKSLAKLQEVPELQPLVASLHVVREAVGAAFPGSQVKLWSAATSTRGPGWIGYNIDLMNYYVCVYFNNPDVLVFETYKAPIDADAAVLFGPAGIHQRWEDLLGEIAGPRRLQSAVLRNGSVGTDLVPQQFHSRLARHGEEAGRLTTR